MSDHAPSPRRLRANVACIRVMNFTWMFMLMMPVIVPYMKGHGLSREQVFQVQAFFGLMVVLLEVPSGYASDLFGRRGCLLLAGLSHGVAYLWLAWVGEGLGAFADLLLFQTLAAISVTLYSGTDVALVYDSVEALGKHGQQRRELSQRLFWMQSGETTAALLTTAILAGSLPGDLTALDHVAGWNALFGWLPFLAALPLVEPPRPRMSATAHGENWRFVARSLWREGPLLRRVLVGLIAYGLSTLLAVWAFQDYWQDLGIATVHFGWLWAGYNGVVALVGRLAHRIESRLSTPRTVHLIGALPVAGWSVMALCAGAPNRVVLALGVAAGLAFQVGRGLTQVVLKDELNHRVPAEMRATANSIASLGVRLAFVPLGPLLGWLIDSRGHGVAFGVFAAACAVCFLILARPLARGLGEAGS